MNIRQATLNDLEALVPLFDGYRQFYGYVSDLVLARTFLEERLVLGQSVVFLALGEERQALGFVQMYPSFCSLAAGPVYILDDLFVGPESRGRGVGAELLRATTDFAQANHAVQLQLSTAITNVAAQRLYEREGWQRDREFYFYNFTVQSPANRADEKG